MADEPHAVVRLLLARMESHPEEFKVGLDPIHGRWVHHIEMIQDSGNATDISAINSKLRDIMMGQVHERVMDELLNGPDKRRKEQEEAEYERNLATQMKMSQYAQRAAQVSQQNAYASQLGQYNQANAAGAQGLGIGTQSPSQPLVIGTGKEAMRIQANGDIQIGNETLNEGLLKNIKKALKL